MGKGVKLALVVVGILILFSVWKRKAIMESVTGIVDTPPDKLAKEDGVTVEVESLARAMESEESGTIPRTAIGWAVKNRAKKAGKSITSLVTASKDPKSNGKYSQQDKGPKYCSTYKSPSKATLNLAASIVSGSILDPTHGSSQWDAPKAQDKLHTKNPSKWKSSVEVAAKRQAEGRKLVMVDGVPNTRFWA